MKTPPQCQCCGFKMPTLSWPHRCPACDHKQGTDAMKHLLKLIEQDHPRATAASDTLARLALRTTRAKVRGRPPLPSPHN